MDQSECKWAPFSSKSMVIFFYWMEGNAQRCKNDFYLTVNWGVQYNWDALAFTQPPDMMNGALIWIPCRSQLVSGVVFTTEEWNQSGGIVNLRHTSHTRCQRHATFAICYWSCHHIPTTGSKKACDNDAPFSGTIIMISHAESSRL